MGRPLLTDDIIEQAKRGEIDLTDHPSYQGYDEDFYDEAFDADVLILYDSKTEADLIAETVNEITSGGESVAALAEVPQNGKYRRIVKISERGLENIEAVD